MPLIPLPALPPPWPPYRDVPDTTDDLPVTIGVRIDPVNNSSETDTFVQPTAGRDLEFYQLLPTRETFEPTDAYAVGPVIYTHFSTANSSDAGFTVDLLFRHPSYAEAS